MQLIIIETNEHALKIIKETNALYVAMQRLKFVTQPVLQFGEIMEAAILHLNHSIYKTTAFRDDYFLIPIIFVRNRGYEYLLLSP